MLLQFVSSSVYSKSTICFWATQNQRANRCILVTSTFDAEMKTSMAVCSKSFWVMVRSIFLWKFWENAQNWILVIKKTCQSIITSMKRCFEEILSYWDHSKSVFHNFSSGKNFELLKQLFFRNPEFCGYPQKSRIVIFFYGNSFWKIWQPLIFWEEPQNSGFLKKLVSKLKKMLRTKVSHMSEVR